MREKEGERERERMMNEGNKQIDRERRFRKERGKFRGQNRNVELACQSEAVTTMAKVLC